MMMDDVELDPAQIMKISEEIGQKCMNAMLDIIGEKRNGEHGVVMNPLNTIILANISTNIMKMVIATLDNPGLIQHLKEQTLRSLTEYFDTQALKIKSTVN